MLADGRKRICGRERNFLGERNGIMIKTDGVGNVSSVGCNRDSSARSGCPFNTIDWLPSRALPSPGPSVAGRVHVASSHQWLRCGQEVHLLPHLASPPADSYSEGPEAKARERPQNGNNLGLKGHAEGHPPTAHTCFGLKAPGE